MKLVSQGRTQPILFDTPVPANGWLSFANLPGITPTGAGFALEEGWWMIQIQAVTTTPQTTTAPKPSITSTSLRVPIAPGSSTEEWRLIYLEPDMALSTIVYSMGTASWGDSMRVWIGNPGISVIRLAIIPL